MRSDTICVRALVAALLAIAAPMLPARAAEAPVVEIVDMDPPAGANVPKNAALYVHFRYRSDVALRAQVKGFFNGVAVEDGVSWNPSPAYPAGAGEGIAWLAFSRPAHLDELRLEVSDAHWQPLLILKIPRNVAWVAIPGEPPRAEWVRRLSDAQQRATHDDLSMVGQDTLSYGLGFFGMLSVPGYFVLQILFGMRWTGGWRIVALAPLLVVIPAIGHAIFALAAGSNLWPILVILASPLAFVYLMIAAIARYARRTRPQTTA